MTPPVSRHLRSGSHGLAAVLTVLALALTACTSAVAEQARTAGAPREGGVIQVGVSSDLVPAAVFSNTSQTGDVLVGSIYDSLIDYPLDSLEPQPALATGWRLGDRGRSLTLDLRDDVTFHSGRPFTSKDVEFSIRTWADPVWSAQLQRTAAAITGFDTSQPHRITLRFEHRLSNVFDLLDMLPMIDSESIDELRAGTAFVGTGPFRFESWSPGATLTLDRNDDYWGQRPYLDGAQIRIITDAQAQLSQLRAGQLDVAVGVNSLDAQSLSSDPRYRVDSWEGSEGQTYLGTNVTNPALADPTVREAISHALDRERIMTEVYRGFGEPATLPWPEDSPARDERVAEQLAYDPDLARRLVQRYESKHGELPSLPLTYTSSSPDYAQVAQIVQEDLAAVGIEVELDPEEHAQVMTRLIGAEFEGLWILGHSYAHFTPSTLAVSAFPFNGEHNASHYSDPRYIAAADAAWKLTPQQAARPGAYADLNRELLRGKFLLEIGILHRQTASGAAVGGLDLTKRGELLLGRAYLGGEGD
ncbi:ABC transporter substrate-binding protein [Nocardioides insulae]|uniref:ABC transporter substrate-binding protein n=1 Tax=Nocardioides insulae TaxID=394734 RepID=UPI0004065D36|nr:ABC transporter substrate-binding protein [Nocardioides insulae]